MESSDSTTDFQQQIDIFRQTCDAVASQIAEVIVGHQAAVDDVLACLLAGGHALLEGVPGLGKTLLVRTLAQTLDVSFARIQFTPDLMPADITGTNVLNADSAGARHFEFQPGPIFANLVLADEINRATPKTQSAVLEAMSEATVTAARTTHVLPQPFMVLATQNPLEMEGTYPLPEAQLDRFMLKISLQTPGVDELTNILDRTTGTNNNSAAAAAATIASPRQVQDMQQIVRQTHAAADVKDYISKLTLATHPQHALSGDMTNQYVKYGASPRGAQAILMAAKVAALRDGRAAVAFDDVRRAAPAALRHRLILSFEAHADAIIADDVIASVIKSVQPR